MLPVILIFLCLSFSLLTAINYIISGFHSKNHRLLPMLMVTVSLYYFYLLVEQVTGTSFAFTLLKDLLLVQVFAILFYYIVDILEIRMVKPAYVLISALDIVLDFVIVLQARQEAAYRRFVLLFLVFTSLTLVAFVIGALVHKSFTRNQRSTYISLFIGFLVPLIGFVTCGVGKLDDRYVMAPALVVTCAIFNYLLITDMMIDATTLMKEELFSSAGAASMLFDADLYFLDASKSARELFPQIISAMEESPKKYRRQDLLIEWTGHYTDPKEIEIYDKFYNCIMQKVFLKGKPWGYILLFNDVTAQKKEAKLAIEDASNKSKYLAKMSHELRSPLHAIIGGSEIVLSKNDTSERSRFMVNQIRNAGEKLLGIVNSILEFSKMDNKVLSLGSTVYDFYDLITEQACNTLVNLRGKNVKFAMQTHTSVARYLVGDELRIREVLQNLLSNAVKFTSIGTIKCDISMEEKNDKAFITIEITDTGVGMSEEQLSNIFKEYVSYAENSFVEGTGLGLAIVKELCNMMGGNVEAKSSAGGGTTMTATFYQEYADVMENGKRDSSKDKAPFVLDETNGSISSGVQFSKVFPTYVYPKARVLLVDDMEVNQLIFQEMTRPWEFMLDKAFSGESAIEMFEKNDYDMIVLDQMMPGMSGIDTIKIIRTMGERGKQVPVIMLTADITDEMKLASKENNFSGFLEKPIVLSKLKEIIENYLPKKLRRPCFATDMYAFSGNNTSMAITESYINECETLLATLGDAFNTDLDLFRTKVHGLKSISRQLDQKNIAEFSEVMEMAAKSGHKEFIKRHLEQYFDDISVVVERMRQEMV